MSASQRMRRSRSIAAARSRPAITLSVAVAWDGDPLAVLDAQLRVRGTQGLRVIDASMMPNIVSGNTNAAVMAVADKAAELILGGQ